MATFPAPAAEFDLEIYRGDTPSWSFTFWQDTGKTIPVDLTGVVAKSQIREKPMGARISDLVTAISLPNTVQVSITTAISHGLPATGAWDLQLTYPGGLVNTPVAGNVAVTPDVTDST